VSQAQKVIKINVCGPDTSEYVQDYCVLGLLGVTLETRKLCTIFCMELNV
jgi:hypothetical protein